MERSSCTRYCTRIVCVCVCVCFPMPRGIPHRVCVLHEHPRCAPPCAQSPCRCAWLWPRRPGWHTPACTPAHGLHKGRAAAAAAAAARDSTARRPPVILVRARSPSPRSTSTRCLRRAQEPAHMHVRMLCTSYTYAHRCASRAPSCRCSAVGCPRCASRAACACPAAPRARQHT